MGVSILVHVLVFSMTLVSQWGGKRQTVEMPFSMVSLVSLEDLGAISSPLSSGVSTAEIPPQTNPEPSVPPQPKPDTSPSGPLVPIKRLQVEEPRATTPREMAKLEAPEVPRAADGLRRAPAVEKNLDQLIPRAKPEPRPTPIVQEPRTTAAASGNVGAQARAVPDGSGTGGSAERERSGSGSPQGTQVSAAVLNVYASRVKQSIQRHWQLPDAQRISGLETVVAVVVDRNGKVLNLQVEKRSGNALFDEAALRAVRRAEPLDPFPDAIQVNQLEFGISFRPQGIS